MKITAIFIEEVYAQMETQAVSLNCHRNTACVYFLESFLSIW